MKPKCIAEYNRYMGGIDKADQMVSYYSSPRKTIRWQLKVFFHLMDLSLWNGHFLYNFGKAKQQQKSYLEFRDAVIIEFLKSSIRNLVPRALPMGDLELPSDHYPMKLEKRLRCRYCAAKQKRNASFYACNICFDRRTKQKIALCVKNDCFKKFHEELLHLDL